MAIGLLGAASTLGIGLAVYMDDQFTQASDRVSNSLRMMGKDLDDFGQGMRTIENFGNGIANFGDKILGYARGASMEFATFDHAINATGIIAGLKRHDSQFKTLADNAERLADTYGQLPQNIAEAELELAKGGKSVPQINKMTEAVIALGAATDTQVGGSNGTAIMLQNIMQAFNATGDQAMHYADIITSAANQSTIDVRDLFDSMRYSADIASTLKIPFQEAATAIATLGNAGLRGSIAGTSYANMLRFLEQGTGIFATKRQKTALGLLGLTRKDFQDEEGHLISMSKLLGLLKARTQGFSDNDKINVLGGIFGRYGNRALLNLLNAQDTDSNGKMMAAFDAMRDKINQDVNKGVAKTTAQRMTEDQLGQINKLKAAWSTFRIEVGSKLAPILVPLIQRMAGIVKGLIEFVRSPFGAWLVRSTFVLGLGMSLIGRLIAMAARFMGFAITGAGQITRAVNMAKVSGQLLRDYLEAGAMAISRAARSLGNAALLARGIPIMSPARNAAGRFTGGMVARSGMGTFLGALFGRQGLRWAIALDRFIAPMVAAGGWLARTFGIVRLLGTGLGKVLGWLFGWEGMLADLILTMLTGKGIFEWLWDGLRTVFGWLFGVTNKAKAGSVYHANAPAGPDSMYGKYEDRTDEQRRLEDKLNKTNPYKYEKVTYHFHIAPNNTGKTLHQEIETDETRQLQSKSIIK